MKNFKEFSIELDEIDTKNICAVSIEKLRTPTLRALHKKLCNPDKEKSTPIRKAAKKAGMHRKGRDRLYNQNEEPRIPRKKGQPAGSDKHSDLYTDENPKGTIHGLKFATVEDAEKSVKKIEGSGKTHAHKIQAAIAMEQRAKVMGKTGPANVYRKYIEKMKKITKEKEK